MAGQCTGTGPRKLVLVTASSPKQQQHKFSLKRFPGLRSDLFGEDFMWAAEGAAHAGAARRRKERRLRTYLRYARINVAMALAESNHHAVPRRQKMARAGEEDDEVHYGDDPGISSSPCGRALSTLLWTSTMSLPPGRGLTARVQRHTGEQVGDGAPFMKSLAQVFKLLDSALPEQVIDVPKISQDSIQQRLVDRNLRHSQMAEHLVEVFAPPQVEEWSRAGSLWLHAPLEPGSGGSCDDCELLRHMRSSRCAGSSPAPLCAKEWWARVAQRSTEPEHCQGVDGVLRDVRGLRCGGWWPAAVSRGGAAAGQGKTSSRCRLSMCLCRSLRWVGCKTKSCSEPQSWSLRRSCW